MMHLYILKPVKATEYFLVLILVVMDDALVQPVVLDKSEFVEVLILVVMDDALVRRV